MTIRWDRFNTYLVVALMVALTAACGCRSPEERQQRKLLSTLRLHLEGDRDQTKTDEAVPVYRAKPVWVRITKAPFLNEAQVSQAAVVDTVGGFALHIQFDHQGTVLLEQCTAANRGRKMAIFCQFGKELKDYRWLAAPVISRRISDGVLVFTPDATRAEAAEIAQGLNNVSKQVHTWVDR
jgi:preprotein translocase subunit SecD